MNKFYEVFNQIKESWLNDQLPCFNLKMIDLDRINQYRDEIRKKFKCLLVIGTGASVLNSKAIISSIAVSEFDIRFLDNLDVTTITKVTKGLNKIDTAILVISKSGNTNETMILAEYIADSLITNSNLFIITENKPSFLTTFGQKYNAKFINHAKDIGGRFAILTPVGLLPAAIAGVNIEKIINLTRQNLGELFNNQDFFETYIKWILSNIEEKRNCYIIIYYGDQLLSLYEWVRQIYAESLGKNGFGFTTIISRGTIDQHSQLQLYLDGPDDKFYEIIYLKNSDLQFQDKQQEINEIFALHADNIFSALNECKRPTLFSTCDEAYRHISISIIKTILSTLIIAKLKNIEPFGQPAVERSKKNIK